MALVIAINAVLCFGVIVAVVAPLVWAILTQQRDTQGISAQRQRRVRAAAHSERHAARPRPARRPAGVTGRTRLLTTGSNQPPAR